MYRFVISSLFVYLPYIISRFNNCFFSGKGRDDGCGNGGKE